MLIYLVVKFHDFIKFYDVRMIKFLHHFEFARQEFLLEVGGRLLAADDLQGDLATEQLRLSPLHLRVRPFSEKRSDDVTALSEFLLVAERAGRRRRCHPLAELNVGGAGRRRSSVRVVLRSVGLSRPAAAHLHRAPHPAKRLDVITLEIGL